MNSFRMLLQKKGYTPYKLNKEHGIPTNTVNDLCNGKTTFINIRVGTALKISKALKMTIEEIFDYLEDSDNN